MSISERGVKKHEREIESFLKKKSKVKAAPSPSMVYVRNAFLILSRLIKDVKV